MTFVVDWAWTANYLSIHPRGADVCVLFVSGFQQMIDLREETPDQTAVRVFQLLRVLKYKPPDSISLWATAPVTS